MSLNLDEIEPALASPDFDPSMVIIVLALPALGLFDCAAVERAIAMVVVRRLMNEAVEVSSGDQLLWSREIDRWSREIDRVIATGMTAVIRLWAIADRSFVSVSGVEIVATAKA